MKMLALITSLFVLTASGTARAATPAGITGTWVAVKDAAPGLTSAPSPLLGAQFALRVDGDTLWLTQRLRDIVVSVPHPLDGTPARSRVPGRLCEADTVSLSTAIWEGDALVLTVIGAVPGGDGAPASPNIKRTLRPVSADMLVVEGSTRLAGQTTPTAVATVYKRSGEPMEPTKAAVGVKTAPAGIADIGWLSGTWIGSEGASEERWTPPAGGSMLAVARTIRNSRMVAFEFLCIAERDGSLVYTAMPNGRTPPTDFMLTAFDAKSATFENPRHDFPKKVRYALLADGTLEATISGDSAQKPVTFRFRKQ